MAKNFNDVYDVLEDIRNTASFLEKERIIRANSDLEILKNVFLATYDNSLNYHLKVVDVPAESGDRTVDDDWDVVQEMLDVLSSRVYTRKKSGEYVKDVLKQFDANNQNVIIHILNRDLLIGVSTVMINKCIPNLIPTFDVALAQTYNEKTFNKVTFDGSWLVSRKIDGVRLVSIKTRGKWSFNSRYGKPIKTLKNLIPELDVLTEGFDNIVLDGEICLVDADGNEVFSGLMKEIKRKNHDIKNPKYKIFDCLTKKEFFMKESVDILSERLARFSHKWDISFKNIELLDQIELTEESFDEMKKKVDKFGWEGLILRKNVGYMGKRSFDILKVKKFYDAEYKVIGYEFGSLTFLIEGKGQRKIDCLSALKIEHKGTIVSIGAGLTKAQRFYYYKYPNKIMGKTIKVQYFEETTNSKTNEISLRFPTLVYIYNEERDL